MCARRANDAAIVMFGDGRDWHGRSLARAFKRRGITPLIAPLNACGFSTETATGLFIPGLGDRLPEGAFVRFVPGGSFEAVVARPIEQRSVQYNGHDEGPTRQLWVAWEGLTWMMRELELMGWMRTRRTCPWGPSIMRRAPPPRSRGI